MKRVLPVIQTPSLTRRAALGLAAGTGAALLAACSGSSETPSTATQDDQPAQDDASAQQAAIPTAVRTTLFSQAVLREEPQVTPTVSDYDVDGSLDGVSVPTGHYLREEALATLAQLGFCVVDDYGADEFFPLYEQNRYQKLPNLVTVDSLMHTYHLYFQYLLKALEAGALREDLAELSADLLQASSSQLQELAGTAWERAALRNVGFFAVALQLLDPAASAPSEVAEVVKAEVGAIMAAAGANESALTGLPVDYTQFSPRGYYTGSEELSSYFRAMMWYGQLSFLAANEDLTRSALLMTLALTGGALARWEAVYAVTSFFAGASDDNGYFEYRAAADEALGAEATAAQLADDEEGWQRFWQLAQQMPAPQINSIPGTSASKTSEDTGFRFMGQRFSIDELIFQHLIYDYVSEDGSGARRMLPDALDVPAALGSKEALAILEEQGATGYAGYAESMDELRAGIAQEGDAFWQASLYNQWLRTIAPLLDAKGEGYPTFMRSQEWTRHDLESFLASYTELKHDTVLYSKQALAEGDGYFSEDEDDRGYVQPEPIVFARLQNLCAATSQGLAAFGLLGTEGQNDLQILESLAGQLCDIALTELAGDLPSDDEFELIRSIGVQLEHFWEQVHRQEAEDLDTYLATMQFPSPVVADVATGDGMCLELGTSRVNTLYAVVPVDGTLRVASGPVFGFRQFAQPASQRLTDEAWREMLRWANSEPTEATSPLPWVSGHTVSSQ